MINKVILNRMLLLVLLSSLLSGCSAIGPLYGDIYTKSDDNVCFYIEADGTCLFLSSTYVQMRNDKNSFRVLFTSTFYSQFSYPYNVDKNNADELLNVFVTFFKWSQLNENDRIVEASKFNGSNLSKNNVATVYDSAEYSYLNKAPSTINYDDYMNTPLLKIYLKSSFLGIESNRTWLFTPKNALKFALMLKVESSFLK